MPSGRGLSQLLTELEAEYAAIAARDEARQAALAEYGVEPLALQESVAPLQLRDLGIPTLNALRSLLLESKEGNEVVERLNTLAPRLTELISVLDTLLVDFQRHDLSRIGEAVRDLREEADALPENCCRSLANSLRRPRLLRTRSVLSRSRRIKWRRQSRARVSIKFIVRNAGSRASMVGW